MDVIYLVIALLAWVVITPVVIDGFSGERPVTFGMIVAGYLVAAILAFAWPLTVVWWLTSTQESRWEDHAETYEDEEPSSPAAQ